MQRSTGGGNGRADGMSDRDEKARLGLCADCRHARTIQSARGSSFLLCGLAATDERFSRYPRLPVLTCPGYQPR